MEYDPIEWQEFLEEWFKSRGTGGGGGGGRVRDTGTANPFGLGAEIRNALRLVILFLMKMKH